MIKGDKLKEKGLKKTALRIELWNIFESVDKLLSVQDLQELLQSPASTSTIYRALDSFLEKGLIQQIQLIDTNHVLYEKVSEEHCHHLICTKCGKVIHVHECPLERYEHSVEEEYHFQVETHQLNLYGLCIDCQEETK